MIDGLIDGAAYKINNKANSPSFYNVVASRVMSLRTGHMAISICLHYHTVNKQLFFFTLSPIAIVEFTEMPRWF